MIAEIIFIALVAFIAYVYFGYPLLLLIISRIYKMKRKIDPKYLPSVTLLVAAYNEEKYMADKLDNCLSLDYPKEKLEIIVFSDASDDGTDDIVKQYQKKGIRLLRIEGRLGKTICQNEAVKASKGDIIIFTDTRAILDNKAIKRMVPHFADPKVGSVLGKLVYRNDEGSIKEGAYWRYEQWIKNTESKIFGSISGTGALYSVRRREYVPLPNYAQSDFTEPISVMIKHGGVPISEPQAIAYNISAGTSGKELRRHERIITRYLFTRKLVRPAYNPFRFGVYALGLISHKSFRFYAPFVLLGILGLNIYLSLDSTIWLSVLGVQLLCYTLAAIGYLMDRQEKGFFLFSIPYHFVILNLAALKAYLNYVRGKNFVVWKNKGA